MTELSYGRIPELEKGLQRVEKILAGKSLQGNTICVDLEQGPLAFSCRARAEMED